MPWCKKIVHLWCVHKQSLGCAVAPTCVGQCSGQLHTIHICVGAPMVEKKGFTRVVVVTQKGWRGLHHPPAAAAAAVSNLL